MHFLGKTLLVFALLHSVFQGQICLLLQVFLRLRLPRRGSRLGHAPRGRRRGRLELGPCLDTGTRELRRPGPSGGRAPPAPGRGAMCVRPRHSGVPGACGSSPTCLREVEASERGSESPALSSAATTALHRATPPGNEGWEEWTNLRKRGLKKGCATTLRPLCQVARLQLRPAPLGTSRKRSSETLQKKEKQEPGDDQEG